MPFFTVETINENVAAVPLVPESKILYKILKEKQKAVLSLLEKKHKIVPENYYRQMWMAAGLAVFGLPTGAASGRSTGNMRFLGMGFPIGMTNNIAAGTSPNRKAEKEGRQLDPEIKY